MRLRLPLITAAVLLTMSVAAPVVASETSTLLNAAPSSGSLEHPNVGDEAPHKEVADERGLLNDEEGLLALGLAAVIAVSTAVVLRRRNRMSSY